MCNTTVANHIQTPILNHLPDIQFRHWASPEDFDDTIAIFNKERVISGIEKTMTRADAENEVKWYKNFEITEQYIYVEKDGQTIGYFDYNYEQELNGNYCLFVEGSLMPEYYEKEIAQAMLAYAEHALKQMAQELPADKPKVFRTWWRLQNEKAVKFFQTNGYEITRYFYRMPRPIELPLKDYPMPEGLEIRPVEPAHYRQIFDAMHEAFQDHWCYIPPTEKTYQVWLEDPTQQPHLWKVAWDGDQVAGMVLNFFKEEENIEFNRKRGYTEEISVRRPWRKRGLAKALIAESIRMFREMEMTETYLSVDVENPSGALKLYRDLGYQENKHDTTGVLDKQY